MLIVIIYSVYFINKYSFVLWVFSILILYVKLLFVLIVVWFFKIKNKSSFCSLNLRDSFRSVNDDIRLIDLFCN